MIFKSLLAAKLKAPHLSAGLFTFCPLGMLLRRLASQQILFLLYTLCSVMVLLSVTGIPFIERVVLVSEKETLTPLR